MHKSFWSHTIALCLEQIKIYVVFTDNIFHNQCEWIAESFENGIRSISQSDPWMNHLDFSINCFTKKLTLTMDSVNNELFILSMNIDFNLFHTKRKKKPWKWNAFFYNRHLHLQFPFIVIDLYIFSSTSDRFETIGGWVNTEKKLQACVSNLHV